MSTGCTLRYCTFDAAGLTRLEATGEKGEGQILSASGARVKVEQKSANIQLLVTMTFKTTFKPFRL